MAKSNPYQSPKPTKSKTKWADAVKAAQRQKKSGWVVVIFVVFSILGAIGELLLAIVMS